MNTNEFIEITTAGGSSMIVRLEDIRDIQTSPNNYDPFTHRIKLNQLPLPFPITAECYEKLRKILLRDE